MPTLTTVPLILLLLYLWKPTGRQILPVVVFTSIFTAASALNVGSLGLSCWLFAMGFAVVAKLFRGIELRGPARGVNRGALLAVTGFVAYAAVSGFVFPFLFAGTPVVRLATAEPLAWGMANIAQLCYLAAAFLIYLIAISSTKQELDVVLVWYVRGCLVASIIAMYQLMNAMFHVPYPSELLYSNQTYVIFPAYQLNGVWRLNGPFTEASEMAGFLIVGIALTGWSMIHKPLQIKRCLSFGIMLVALLMTQSTVGYVTVMLLAVISAVMCVRYLWRGGSLGQGKVLLGVLAVGAAVTLICLYPSAVDTTQKVIAGTLFEKQNTDSYRDRTLTHVTALETLAATSYIGVGWGSSRASGLIYVLLANTGVLGVGLFGLMLLSFFTPFLGGARAPVTTAAAPDGGEDYSLGAILFAMSMLLVTMFVAGSELGMPILWVLFGAATVAPATQRLAAGDRQLASGRPVFVNGPANFTRPAITRDFL